MDAYQYQDQQFDTQLGQYYLRAQYMNANTGGSGGRDHYLQHFSAFAGAGVRGGKVIGATNAAGSDVTNFGWKQHRYIRPEDVMATVYSAMGIEWTKQLETPFGRTYEYVPVLADGLYAPIDELWM